jgi:hypothetical protein
LITEVLGTVSLLENFVESENVELLVGEFFCCFRFRNNAQSNLSFTRLKMQEIDNNEEYKMIKK